LLMADASSDVTALEQAPDVFDMLGGVSWLQPVRINRSYRVRLSIILMGIIIAAATLCPSVAASDFYAYHTHLDYEIPEGAGIDYIPQVMEPEFQALRERLWEMEDEEEEDEEELDEEEEEEPAPGPITGRYADVVVNVAPGRQFVFSRETAYQPYWKTEQGRWFVSDIVPREKDVACLYSYARIIENRPDRVLVHWRYIPDLRNVSGFADAVHEYFEITPDARVVRKIRETSDKLEHWEDPANVSVQTLILKPGGIEEISFERAKLSKRPGKAIFGAPVTEKSPVHPAAWWKFDEGLQERPYEKRDLTKESVSGTTCSVEGNITLWKEGVSGTALAFDGYNSRVALPAKRAPSIEDELTVEAWVVLGAYPWNWAPLVHQSIVDPGPIERGTYDESGRAQARSGGSGYYLGVNAYGYPIFVVNGREVKGSAKLATYRWTHLAGTYGNGRMRVYVDGRECGSVPASGSIDLPDTDLVIGLNNRKGRATDPVRGPINHLPAIYGIEGLIDEVRIYDAALAPEQISESYDGFETANTLRDRPDLQPRVLPGETGAADKFGAYHTRLRYHELWDNLWRVGDYSDVVVKFDEMPSSVVYWRGANSAPGWVTENNKWMEDQSCETGGPHGCSEHMADKQCRHAYVRVIENTDARVVIHWRYASIDVGYLFPSLRHWADEYHTIYPDGAGVRKVHFRGGITGWQDIQFFSQPGTGPLDNVNLQALTLANLEGEVRPLTWKGNNGVPRNTLPDACIERINFKSEYKVFAIFQEGTHINPWGHMEQSVHTDDPFAGPWNHWPVSQIPSDGRYAVDSDRLTHAAIGAADNVVWYGNMALYGFTNKDASTLVPLARSWNHPPKVIQARGCSNRGYDKAQRAYLLTAETPGLSFTIEASERSPVVNPAFVIRHWYGSGTAHLKIDGKPVASGKDFRQGVVRDTDGNPTLVVWVRLDTTSPVLFEITED